MADSERATSTPASPRAKPRLPETPAPRGREATDSGAVSPLAAGIILAPALALVGGFYGRTFRDLFEVWNNDPNYSHGPIVPLMCLGFAALAWKSCGPPVRTQATRGAAALGTAEIVFGVVLHVAAWFRDVLLFDVLSMIFILRGLLLVLGGKEINRAYGFSALFSIFMAPLPIAWYQPLAIEMQHFVSVISATLLEMCGIPAYREGYFIHVPGYTMEVAEACSGLRQLTAVLALGVAIGHLSGRRAWFRWTLGLLSLPVAVGANCIRVTLSGAIMMLFGRKWAEGVFHTLEGLVIVALAAALIVGLAWALAKLDDRLGGKPRRLAGKPQRDL